jgi:hypothetical protein
MKISIDQARIDADLVKAQAEIERGRPERAFRELQNIRERLALLVRIAQSGTPVPGNRAPAVNPSALRSMEAGGA